MTSLPEQPEQLAWRVHPAAQRRGTGVLVLAVILILSVLAGAWMGNAYWSLFAFVVLFLSLEAFFLPSRFELTGEGVTVHKAFSKVTRPWGDFRRVVFDRAGVTLSPFGRRHWLEAYRSLRLRYAETGSPEEAPSREMIQRFILRRIRRDGTGIVGLAEAQVAALRGSDEEADGGEPAPAGDPVETTKA